MPALDGANTEAVLVLGATADTYGVANAATATEDKLICESINLSESVDTLSLNSIGSGQTMSSDIARGAFEGALALTMVGGYHNAFAKVLAQFQGASTLVGEQTVGQGDYLHRLTVAGSPFTTFCTVAYESSTTTVREAPSVTFTDLTLTMDNAPNYVELSATALANEIELTTAVNTNAVIAAAGEEDTERVILERTDQIFINAQAGGALGGGDEVCYTSAVLNLSRPQEFVSEVCGSNANSAPVSGGLMTGTLTLTLKESEDHVWDDAAQAETEYKASLQIQGTQINAGLNKSFEIFIPRMKQIVIPEYAVSDPGQNAKTVTFEILAAAANPTGMDDTLPYFEFINEKAATYIV